MNVHEKADLAIGMLESERAVAIDAETNGIIWYKSEPVGWAVSDGIEAVYVPMRHGGGANHPFPDEFEERMNVAINRGKGALVGHHMKFDLHMLLNRGITVPARRVSCTMNNEALIDDLNKDYSLTGLAIKYKVELKKDVAMHRYLSDVFGCPPNKDSMANYWKLPGDDPMAVQYAETDALATCQIYRAQCKKMAELNLETVHDMERRLITTLLGMERLGIRVDEEYLACLPDILEERINSALALLPPDFNVRSPVQVRNWVSRFRTDWPVTEKGNPSFTRGWLSSFPEGEAIVKVREWMHARDAFVKPLIERHVHKGRVHCTFAQNRSEAGGTVTGRLACSHPNLMGVPKHNRAVGELYRRAFLPEHDHVLVEADYSQIEPRLFAHFSQDETLMRGYQSDPPKDAHTMAAELMNKDRATVAKRMNMGMFTGMFPMSFAEHMGLPAHEAKRLWDEWHHTFPGIRPFQDGNKRRMLRDGYVTTFLGRRGSVSERRFAYRATSRIIQGGQADILKYKMLEFSKSFLEMPLALTVHDSLVFSVPKDSMGLLGEAKEFLEDLGGPPFNLTVPMVVDIGQGENWAEASYG